MIGVSKMPVEREIYSKLRFEVFTVVKFEVEVFWYVASCSDMVRYQRFGGPCCLHLRGEVKRDATRSEMLAFYHNSARHLNPEDLDLHRKF
jgi:hypothetical protein